MAITKNIETKQNVLHLEQVNHDTFLTGERFGHIELINYKDLIPLSHL